jgi:transcriptional regulator with XRE-family HTH domain
LEVNGIFQNCFGFYFLHNVGVYLMVNVSKIRGLLKEHGWSASHLCRLFGKNVAWLADMERGRGLPDENTLQAIADKLDTTVNYLTDKTDQKEKPRTNSGEHFSEKHEPTELERILEQQPGLMFHGAPLTEDDRAKLITAINAVMSIEDKKHKK